MSIHIKIFIICTTALISAILLTSSNLVCRPAFDAHQLESTLSKGFNQVENAIALRDKILARGHDFNLDNIPEFEDHLPLIESHYKGALKDSTTKLNRLAQLLGDMRMAFKQKQVTLGRWNALHLLLNQLMDSDADNLKDLSWTFQDGYGRDNFLCFIYSTDGKIGIKTYNYAHANNIWVLPMPINQNLHMFDKKISAHDFTNAMRPYNGAFTTKVNAGKLLAIYKKIDNQSDPIDRAHSHLALYLLLRFDDSPQYQYIDSAFDILMNAKEQFITFDIPQGPPSIKDRIFDTLRYSNGLDDKFEITLMDDLHYSISAKDTQFVVTLSEERSGTHLSYIDKKKKKIKVPLSTPYELSNSNPLDINAISLLKAIGHETSREDLKSSLIPLIDTFISQHTMSK